MFINIKVHSVQVYRLVQLAPQAGDAFTCPQQFQSSEFKFPKKSSRTRLFSYWPKEAAYSINHLKNILESQWIFPNNLFCRKLGEFNIKRSPWLLASMDLTNIMLSKRSQKQKRTYSVSPLVQSSKAGKTNLCLYKSGEWLPLKEGGTREASEMLIRFALDLVLVTWWAQFAKLYWAVDLWFMLSFCTHVMV